MSLGSVSSCGSCGCAPESCAPCESPSTCANCVSCCCSAAHTSWRQIRIKGAVTLEYLSSLWMVVEVVGSIGVGLLAGSFALLAFGGDSVVELISSTVVLRHLRSDAGGSEHPGMRTARAANLLLFSLIPLIGGGSVISYLSGLKPAGSPLGIAIAAGAVVVMPYLWLRKRRMGEQTRCLPLSIDAAESATCFFMSVALLGGLLAEYLLGLWWVDYIATAVILAFVTREAFESLHEVSQAA